MKLKIKRYYLVTEHHPLCNYGSPKHKPSTCKFCKNYAIYAHEDFGLYPTRAYNIKKL